MRRVAPAAAAAAAARRYWVIYYAKFNSIRRQGDHLRVKNEAEVARPCQGSACRFTFGSGRMMPNPALVAINTVFARGRAHGPATRSDKNPTLSVEYVPRGRDGRHRSRRVEGDTSRPADPGDTGRRPYPHAGRRQKLDDRVTAAALLAGARTLSPRGHGIRASAVTPHRYCPPGDTRRRPQIQCSPALIESPTSPRARKLDSSVCILFLGRERAHISGLIQFLGSASRGCDGRPT